MHRRLARAAVALLLLGTFAADSAPSARAAAGNVTPFQGLGAWVDLYDPALLAAPERTVAAIAARGVKTLYLETSNYRMPRAVMNARSVGRYLDAAHARGIRVVAWYVPAFTDLAFDLERVRAAIRFRSPGGERFDAFGLDIEATQVPDHAERSRRAVELSRRIRRDVGPGYPLAAIVLPPPLLEDSPAYWAGFPYRDLAPVYDAFLPMGYWTYRYDGLGGAYDFTVRTIEGLRALTGRPSLPIHPIGGIADAMDSAEARGFVRAVREYGAIGASLYDVGTSGAEDWAAMRSVVANPVQEPPSPLRLNRHFGAFGNVPGGDVTHPRDVVFRVGRRAGTWELDLDAFAVGAEIDVLVNWRRVATITPLSAWGPRQTIRLPRGSLGRARNTIVFTARSGAAEPVWGVRRVSLLPAPLAGLDRRPHGAFPGRDGSRADRVTYAVRAGGAVLSIAVRGFDVGPHEVVVRLGDVPIGTLLPTGPGEWGVVQRFVVPLHRPAGTYRLTFDAVAFPPERSVWGVRLLEARPIAVSAV